MMNCKTAILCALTLLFLPSPAFCWDKYGHMLIAEVAYEKLTPAARRQVDRLLVEFARDPHVAGLEPKYLPCNAVTAAAWMDDIKPNRIDTSTAHSAGFNAWHYINLPDGPLSAFNIHTKYRTPSAPNAYEVLEDKCLTRIRDRRAPIADRARLLAMFLHLAGDLHQPLHCIGRDRGGNGDKITALPAFDPTWQIDNLHAFWDNAYRYDVVDGKIAVVCSDLDMPRTMAPGRGRLKAVADKMLLPLLPKRPQALDPADWAAESHNIAVSFALPAVAPTALSPAYVHHAHISACRRMALAGWRIAQFLNRWFK